MVSVVVAVVTREGVRSSEREYVGEIKGRAVFAASEGSVVVSRRRRVDISV